ncbi:alpha/beta hydrolase [Marinobacter sp.]|uniref:alpha/beta hydrolase n=1 Tax=Marinobacter sp. TaxID=50741 RepID=UPI0034A28AD6
MALDQSSSEFLQQLADQGAPAFHTLTAPAAREFFAGLREIIGEGPDVYGCEDLGIPSGATTLTLRTLVPTENPEGIIVYLHGGGWVVGALDDYDTLGRFIATESNCAVVLVDYRLAPEYPFPAATDDAWAALQWVASNRQRIVGKQSEYDDLPIIVAGDSAGGNLAAVCARKARDAGGPEIAQQVLIYPVTQPDLSTPGYQAPENQGLLGQQDMAWFWDCYVPNADQRQDPDASPLLADNLDHLPPAVVITAEHDVLSDEGAAYAKRLQAAGVPVHFRQFDGQIHGFFTILNALPASETARGFVVEHMRKAVTNTTSVA